MSLPKHGSNLPGTVALPLDVLKVMRYLQSRNWEQVAVLQLRPEVLGQIEAVLARYIVYHLERTFRAPVFLEQASPAAGSPSGMMRSRGDRRGTTVRRPRKKGGHNGDAVVPAVAGVMG